MATKLTGTLPTGADSLYPAAMTNSPGGSLGYAGPAAQTNLPGGSLGMPGTAAQTNTIAQPAPLVPPTNVPPVPSTPPQTFPGHAPTSNPYGDFTAPDPTNFDHSPDYQYQLDEQAKARQRSAAARGTLLTGGTVKALQRDAAGTAAGDYQHAYDRALGTYTTNRATNAQNFDQSMGTYQGNLAGFNANTTAAGVYGHLGLDSQAQAYGQAHQGAVDQQANQQDQNNYTAAQGQNAADAYARQVAAQNAAAAAANAAENARPRAPMARTPRLGSMPLQPTR